MKNILIVGAGPTGLTAALELSRRGVIPHIIDRKEKPSTLSRAVGINPRTLDILEASGVTKELLAHGFKMTRANFHKKNGSIIGAMRMDMIPHKYNFMLALPQDKTETIMQERLATYDVNVEYGVETKTVRLSGEQAEVTLKRGTQETKELYDLVIAADGAHSVVRQSLGIPFDGFDYKNLWSINDFISLDFPYAPDEAHMFLDDNAVEFGLVIRIGEHRYRAVSSTEKALPCIPGNYTVEKILGENTFHISVRQAETYQKGCVYLAGDAAHVHSPAGGRGMNLGIEDAWDLSRRIAEGRLEGYTKARHPAGKQVLKLSENLVHIVNIKNPLAKFLRNNFLRLMTAFPILQKPLMKNVAGLESVKI